MRRLHTTTVRFDADAWEAICREADRLGVARSMFIREAPTARIARCEQRSELRDLADRVEHIERRLALAIVALRRLLRRG